MHKAPTFVGHPCSCLLNSGWQSRLVHVSVSQCPCPCFLDSNSEELVLSLIYWNMGGDVGVLSCFMYQKLLEFKLKEVISREPTILVLVVGVPNVGKSSLINLIPQIVSSCFPGKLLLCFCWIMVGCHFLEMELWWRLLNYWTITGSVFFLSALIKKKKKVFFHSAGEYEATLGPLPSVTQDIAGYKVKRFFVLWFIYLIK